MMQDLHDDIHQIAPTLAKLEKTKIEAPEGYFDTFSERMLNRIKSENIKPEPKIFAFNKLSKYFAAASIFIVLGVSIYIFKIQHQTASVKESSIEDIYLSEIDESTLIDYHTTVNNVDEGLNFDEYQNYLDEQSLIEHL